VIHSPISRRAHFVNLPRGGWLTAHSFEAFNIRLCKLIPDALEAKET
jgi:hypothetical protein